MSYLVGWCVLAGVLAWILRPLLRRAPYGGVPPDAVRFFVRLEEVLRARHPGVDVVGLTGEGFGAVLRLDRQELPVPLGEVFLRERAFPAAFGETVDRLVAELRTHMAAVGDLPFDEAVDRILPQIRSEEWVRSNSPAFGPGRILMQPLLDDLVTCYVLDEPGSIVFVTQGHVDAWGTKAAFLDNLAMTNLRRLARTAGGLPIPHSGDAEPCVLHSGDGYDAARVLLAADAVDETKGLVFGIPDRDTLVVGRKGDGLARLMGEVGVEYQKSAHPISPKLYEVAGTGLREVGES